MLQLLKHNQNKKIQKERNTTMIVKTAIPPDAHELYDRVKAGKPILESRTRITSRTTSTRQ